MTMQLWHNKMRQTIIFFLFVLLMAVSALAVDVTLPKTDFAHGEMVVSSISCAGDAVLRVQNPEGQLIYVDQGRDDWESSYHTNSDSSKGKYTIRVSCEDATNSDQFFCVDAPGCIAAIQNNPPPPPPPVDNRNNGGSSSGGGGGRARCKPQWDCDVWTFCNSTAQQSRPCKDVNNCEKAKTEVRECIPCRESWACSAWSECNNGLQARNCVDDYDCGTGQYKPTLSKRCDDDYVSGPEPARFSSQLPPPRYSNTGTRAPAPVASSEPTFWEEYKVFILAGVALLLVAIIMVVFFLLRRKKQVVYNHDELKDWIKQERAAGTSDADIRQILMQQTGWTKEDVERAFSDLSTPAAMQPVQSAGAQGASSTGVKQSSTQSASQTGSGQIKK